MVAPHAPPKSLNESMALKLLKLKVLVFRMKRRIKEEYRHASHASSLAKRDRLVRSVYT
jgi:hypothetical protein